jgi:hypothetical protein
MISSFLLLDLGLRVLCGVGFDRARGGWIFQRGVVKFIIIPFVAMDRECAQSIGAGFVGLNGDVRLFSVEAAVG